MTRIRHYLNALLLIIIALCISSTAWAAAVWTPQSGTYFQYKIPPRMTNAYQLTTDVDVPTHWVKQDGTFTKFISGGGANKYEKIAGKDSDRPIATGKTTEAYSIVATVEQVLTNAVENFETCNTNAIRHNALIDRVEALDGEICVCGE